MYNRSSGARSPSTNAHQHHTTTSAGGGNASFSFLNTTTTNTESMREWNSRPRDMQKIRSQPGGGSGGNSSGGGNGSSGGNPSGNGGSSSGGGGDNDTMPGRRDTQNAMLENDKQTLFTWFKDMAVFGEQLQTYNHAKAERAHSKASLARERGDAMPEFPTMGAKQYRYPDSSLDPKSRR